MLQKYTFFSNVTKVHIFFVRSVLLARSFLRLQVTGKVFAKGGLNWTEKFNFDQTVADAFPVLLN